MKTPRLKSLVLALCAALLSTAAIFGNWTIYVFAVNAGHVIEASLGYYINPLMNMAAHMREPCYYVAHMNQDFIFILTMTAKKVRTYWPIHSLNYYFSGQP